MEVRSGSAIKEGGVHDLVRLPAGAVVIHSAMPRGLGTTTLSRHASGAGGPGNRAAGRTGDGDSDGMAPPVWESAMVPLYEEYIDVCCSMYFDGSAQGVTVDGLRGYFRRLIERERGRPARPEPLTAIPKEAMAREGATGIVDAEARRERLLAEISSCTGGLLTSRLRKRQAIDLQEVGVLHPCTSRIRWGPFDAALFLAGLSRYGRNWHRIGKLTTGRKDAKDVADMEDILLVVVEFAHGEGYVTGVQLVGDGLHAWPAGFVVSGEAVSSRLRGSLREGGSAALPTSSAIVRLLLSMQSSTGGRLKGISLTPQEGHSDGWGRRSPLGLESPSSPMSMSIVVKCRMMMEEMSIELQQMKDTKCDLERKIRATEIECANLREDYQKELNRRREMQNELQEAEIAKGDLEAQHASIQRKLLLAESRASEAEKQCDELRNDVDSITARLSEATAAKSRAELQAADAEAEVHTLKTELCETGSRLVEIEEVRCKDLEDFQAQLVEAERHWREELDAKYEEIAQLTDTLSETTDALEAQRSENEVLTERSVRAEDQHTRQTKELQHHICMLEGELKSSCQSARLVAESERDNATYARNQALETEAGLRREFAEKLQQQREKYKRRIRELEEALQKRKDYEARIKELLKTETSLLRRMNDAKAITSPDPPCLTASPRCHHGHRFRD
ncbi:hypothetical protein FOZ62_027460, partial [Perkinsus olseni]